jgi:parallel beta-helix repeat protein
MLPLVILALACRIDPKTDLDDTAVGDDGGSDGPDDDPGDSGMGPDDSGPPPVEDADHDGVTTEEGDCDDDDHSVHPGGNEGTEADGADQDCNDVVDDALVCSDSVYTTIQDAIDTLSSGFTIFVCPGTYPENLAVDHRLRIESTDGADVTLLEGDGKASVVSITHADGSAIVGFTITGGHAENGGGIFVDGVEVEITDNVISDNVADTRGGGLYLDDATGTVSGNRIRHNTAYEGGGFFANDDILIEDNDVTSNACTTIDEKTYGGGGGGAGGFVQGDPRLVGNRFEENSSSFNGGGLMAYAGRGDITGNTFTANVAVEDGGGFYLSNSSNDVEGNEFVDNTCTDDGAGMRVYIGTGVVIADNRYIGNTSQDNGGGLKLSHSHNTIRDNYFEDNTAADAGGGLELDNETSDVSGCRFVANHAAFGAGMHSWMAEGDITLSDLEFEENVASGCGGALGVDNDPHGVTVEDITMWDNRASYGAAFCMEQRYQDDKETITQPSEVELRNVAMAGNVANGEGSVAFVKFGSLRLENVTAYDASGDTTLSADAGEIEVVNTIFASVSGAFATLVNESAVSLEYSLFFEGGEGWGDIASPVGIDGNIDEDPEFVDPGAYDFRLEPTSAAINAGDPDIKDPDHTRSDMGYTGGPGATE